MTKSELNILNVLVEAIERHTQIPSLGDGWIKVDEFALAPEELHRASVDLAEREITDVTVSAALVLVEALDREDPATDYPYATWKGLVTLYRSSDGIEAELHRKSTTECPDQYCSNELE